MILFSRDISYLTGVKFKFQNSVISSDSGVLKFGLRKNNCERDIDLVNYS